MQGERAAAIDWPAVRKDYEAEQLTLAEICERHGVARDLLVLHARASRWSDGGRAEWVDRGLLITRMIGVIEKQVSNLERADMTSTGDKEAAVLARLASTLEKLIEIDQKATGRKPDRRQTKEMQDLRNKLVARIEAMKRA